MVLGLVVDWMARARPICTEMWPGNTADVGVLLPIIDRLAAAVLPLVGSVSWPTGA